ncbi:MAG: aldehyde dehydrogenase family protein [Deltaproteobacteria bacterium]|jgi:succinate-semialdehyde dehydrogenase|nr:aldehyde dehydrogenase family protein [Deltaproteobacteria bacterium]
MTSQSPPSDGQAYIQGLLEKARKAQKQFESFSQENVDKVCKAIGKTIFDNAEILAQEAVNETGMGDVASKIRKQRTISMSHWDYIKDKKSVGVIEDDPASRVTVYAKPIGVIACITPTTNPTSTACGNGMYAIKSRNAIIVAPHPRAKKVTAHGVNLIREAIAKAGAPIDLMQVIEEPTIDLTKQLMAACDCTIATGGPGMVKSAYASGRPSFGVGPGNCQSIMDRGCQDLYPAYVDGTIRCRTTDQGIQCNGEQTLHLPVEERDAVLAEFQKQDCYVLHDEAIIDKIRKLLFSPEGAINLKVIGLFPYKVAKEVGLDIPESTKILLVKGKGTLPGEILCREKLCPIVTFLTWDKFEEGVQNGLTNLSHEGAGHSSVVFSRDPAHIDLVAKTWPVSRLSVNVANMLAGGNSPIVGFPPTMSLGCGSWGNNSLSENVTYRHLMNTTKVAKPLDGAPTFDPEKVWA